MRTIQHKGHEFRLVHEASSVFLTQAIFTRLLDFKCGIEVLTFTRFNLSTSNDLEISNIQMPTKALRAVMNQLFEEDKKYGKRFDYICK